MAMLHDIRELSVTEATARGVAGLVADAEHGSDMIVTRRGRSIAAIVGIERLSKLEAAVADLYDLAIVLARAATDEGRRTSLDDVLAAYGHTRDSVADLPDDE